MKPKFVLLDLFYHEKVTAVGCIHNLCEVVFLIFLIVCVLFTAFSFLSGPLDLHRNGDSQSTSCHNPLTSILLLPQSVHWGGDSGGH